MILGTTSAHLVFGQDRISRQLHEVNWSYLTKRRFDVIMRDNNRERATRLHHFYKVGDQVMIRVAAKDRGTKHREVAKGPYSITEVHKNGTVNIAYGVTKHRVNIRCLFLC
ncbi:Pol Polyprotein [Phytophthora megakarya]|uniref:Pol Polyprotein n=1 Tax=Phytophthora megakarya TaxID=4795 RepID=A0A225UJ25_9STRA|nr:Pol Polyprotein [Phytophthora megakarya]